jgi:hypothetical protein
LANVLPLSRIKLDITLWDGAPDKYVKATIKADGVETAYSPVALVHIGLGQYYMEAFDIIFPELAEHVSIVYEIFTDNAYSIKSNQHSTVSEHYLPQQKVEIQVDGVDEILEEITRAIARLDQADIEIGIEEMDEVEVYITDEQENIEVNIDEIEEVEVHIMDEQENVNINIDETEEVTVNTIEG